MRITLTTAKTRYYFILSLLGALVVAVGLLTPISTAQAQGASTPGGQCVIGGCLDKTASPNPVVVGQPLTFAITFTNRLCCEDVQTITDTLPDSVNFESVSVEPPSEYSKCSTTPQPGTPGGTVSCNVDAAVSSSATETITVTPTQCGTFTNTAESPFTSSVDQFTTLVATVDFTVNCPPVANDDSYSTDEDQTLNVDAGSGVLKNDTDPDGDKLTAVKVSDPTHGTLTLNPDGSFSYTPTADFNGTDSFTYKANDGSTDSNAATVTITVNPVNQQPNAVDDSYSIDQDQSLEVPAPGVLSNDTDPQGDSLTALKETDPAHGTLTLNSDGSFSYTPTAGFSGSDSFTYKAQDASAHTSNPATVGITVNSAPPATSPGSSCKHHRHHKHPHHKHIHHKHHHGCGK